MMTEKEFMDILNANQTKLENDAEYQFRQILRGQKAVDNRSDERMKAHEKASDERFKAGVGTAVRVGDGVKKHVSKEHDATRKHVSKEHETTRTHISEEASRIVTTNTNEHETTRTRISTEASSIRTDVRRFCGIDVRIWAFILPTMLIMFLIGWFKIGPAVASSGLFIQRGTDGTPIIDEERVAAVLKTMRWLFGLLSMVIGALIADAVGSIILYFSGRDSRTE